MVNNAECNVFDFRRHIAFDVNQIEFPVKCDLCGQHATHFCVIHRGMYCVNHISNHDGILLDRVVTSKDSSELVKRFEVLEDGVLIFSEEDIDLVAMQTGANKEMVRNALIVAKGGIARAILLLTTG